MKLHLCCGDVYLKGYINCDIDGDLGSPPPMFENDLSYYYRERLIGSRLPTHIDQRLDLLEIPWNFADNSMEEVIIISGIEHFSKEDAQKIIREVWRILKWGGKFIVDFPDIKKTVEKYLYTDPEFCMRLIYGSHRNEYAIHHWGYTRDTFKDLLGYSWVVTFKEIVHHEYPVISCIAMKCKTTTGGKLLGRNL